MDAEKAETVQLLLRIPADLKEKVEASADAQDVSVSAWAERVFRENLLPDDKQMSIQHKEARKLLPMLFEANQGHRFLTYASAAKALGRDPRDSARMIGGVTDLLDAAAALANVPLIALYTVRKAGNFDVNPDAFKNLPELRKHLLDEAKAHTFTPADFASITTELDKLKDKGNRAAWRHVREVRPLFKDVIA